MSISRRQFVVNAARLGGLATGYAALQAIGLVPTAPANAALPAFPRTTGVGKKVAVLGGGQAGLAAAFELEKLGFDVTVIEAGSRIGGKVWSIRNGDRIVLNGTADQLCNFSEGLYFNAGAARIPSQHTRVLDYCRTLSVRLEPEINVSQSALLYAQSANGGRALAERRLTFDIRGRISELLTKATKGGALDKELSADDRERLLRFLRDFGDLGMDGRYAGSARAGYKQFPAYGNFNGTANDALSLSELLSNPDLAQTSYADTLFNQPTMLQPVGGMDHLPRALAKALRTPVLTDLKVVSVATTASRAHVICQTKTGQKQRFDVDFVVAALPLPVLAQIESNLTPATKAAIRLARQGDAVKVAFEAPRFWERESIYGGLSFVDGDTSVVWYPSGELMSDRGVLVGCYAINARAKRFSQFTLDRRIALAREAVDHLHPGHGQDLNNALMIDWRAVPLAQGPWVEWGDEPDSDPSYLRLQRPDGRIHFAGSHVSPLVHWQEGAFISAHAAVQQIAEASLNATTPS